MDTRLFFIHIQKTAGGTLRAHLKSCHPSGEGALYPSSPFENDLNYYWNVRRLQTIPPERMEKIKVFSGHFPYVACKLVSVPVKTITILREPVQRTLSFLKMRANNPKRQGMSPEEIYDNQDDFIRFIHNHQLKLFAMNTEESLRGLGHKLDFNTGHFKAACSNLRSVHILGLKEKASEMFDFLIQNYGANLEVSDKHVAKKSFDFSNDLIERIKKDNAMEIEFYEYAAELYKERGGCVDIG